MVGRPESILSCGDGRIPKFDSHVNPGSNKAEVESEAGSGTHCNVIEEFSEPDLAPWREASS